MVLKPIAHRDCTIFISHRLQYPYTDFLQTLINSSSLWFPNDFKSSEKATKLCKEHKKAKKFLLFLALPFAVDKEEKHMGGFSGEA